ncbi:MAG: MurR/RpiR family transcriptional regulator [Pseudomonadota bacterium]
MKVSDDTQASLQAETLPPRKGRSGAFDVISALQNHDGHFAAQEQRVADYVKEHLDDISSMSIGDLAERSAVSKPTVIRFCRSLGCDGFPDFKLRLAQNLAVSAQYMRDKAATWDPAENLVIDHVIDAMKAGVLALRNQIDVAALDQARDALLRCNQIVFAGIGGGSSMVAKEAANRFFRLGIPSANVSDSYLLQMRAATLSKGDVFFAISASGEADAVVGAAEIAVGYGATTICLSKPKTRLSAASTIQVTMSLPEDPDIFKPTSSRYAHLIVVDALATAVAQEQAGKTKENLRRIRASLTAYHGRTGPQPLGD